MKKIIILTTIAFALVVNAQTKKLTLETPPAQLLGTPTPINLPNLEKNMKNPTPEVPADVKNVASKKKVKSSDDFPLLGELAMVTDGDKEATEGSFVELGDGLQWVQIDLENPYDIYAIALWHYHSQERAYKDVIVMISNDPEFKKDVEIVFNNDHDNSSKFGKGSDKAWVETNNGKLIDLSKKPVKGRYVRLYSDGNTANEQNHYTEVEVYGK